jgi:hypothetical protein
MDRLREMIATKLGAERTAASGAETIGGASSVPDS